jgi:glycosyltransferase involved in cell wall biosynthesis
VQELTHVFDLKARPSGSADDRGWYQGQGADWVALASQSADVNWITRVHCGPQWRFSRLAREKSYNDGCSVTSTVLYSIPWELHLPGGVNEVVRNLLDQSRRSGELDPALLVTDYSFAQPAIETAAGQRTVRMRLVAVWRDSRPVRYLLTALVRLPSNFVRLVRMLRQVQPRAVNVHFPGLSSLTLLWALRRACPGARFVLSFHGIDLVELERGGWLTRQWWRVLLRSADGITCCSRDLAARLIAAAGTNIAGVVAIHNGVDTTRLAAEIAGHAPLSDIPRGAYVINVGTFETKKGQDVLVRAFAQLRERRADLSLVLVGRSGPQLQELRDLIDSLGLRDCVDVRLNLPHDQTLSLIRAARVFALSSRQEPFGIVLLEAAYFTIPVVATRVGGVPEVVADEVSGLLVPADDVAALANALGRVLDDESLARRLADNARERTLNEFTWRDAFVRYRSLMLPDAAA